MTVKLDITGEDLVRVRKRRSPRRSGKLRKPVEPRGKITREVINDARETIMKKTDKPLNELSKKTLGSYIKKAAGDFGRVSDQMTKIETSAPDADALSKNKGQYAKWLKLSSKYNSREKGIHTAVDKLTKEEIVPVEKKKSIQEMYKKEPISADLVSRIMEKITPEVIESLGPLKPIKGDQKTSTLGPKKPTNKDVTVRDKIKKNFSETN